MNQGISQKPIKKVHLVTNSQWFYTGHMMRNVLCAWLGQHDIDGAKIVESGDYEAPGASGASGPIASALDSGDFDSLLLLSNYPAEASKAYTRWAKGTYPDIEIDLSVRSLTSPTAYGEIYKESEAILRDLNDGEHAFTFHLSPGTPAMASVWILLASGPYRARLIETHKEVGMKEVELPFEISARFRPGQILEGKLSTFNDSLLPPHPAFDSIIHSTREMKQAVDHARRSAQFDIPVLLLGESGTGKELFAKAIHDASDRREGPFIAVNCGAIPASLAESSLFGHNKGAFTGAFEARPGYVEQADGGTLFLDEIGELPLDIQVKLLRVLNDRKVTRIGENRVRKIDFRLISATNRNLLDQKSREKEQSPNFRSDLYHRIAVGVIKLPPLRQRRDDIPPICGHILKQLNREFSDQKEWTVRTLSADAMEVLRSHRWPGNIRELINTLTRTVIYHPQELITGEMVAQSIIGLEENPGNHGEASILEREVGPGFSLEDTLAEVAAHYLRKAMAESGGRKKEAAQMLGFSHYQTLDNWLRKYLGE